MSSRYTIKTHPNFKSVIPDVCDAKTMQKYVGGALAYQYMFDKRTTPWERKNWDEDELQKFEIDLQDIDRLYHIYRRSDEGGSEYRLIGRMEYKNLKKKKTFRHSYQPRCCCRRHRPHRGCSLCSHRQKKPQKQQKPPTLLYIELKASCDFTGFLCQGGGVIFISSDANLFMRIILRFEREKHLIYKSLAEDGIEVEEQQEYDLFSRMFWNNPPSLKYLCHEVVYLNKEFYDFCLNLLPKILFESVREFIKTEEAKIAYRTRTGNARDFFF